MADNRKLSVLPAAPILGSDDLMYVVREGLSCRASLGQFVTFAAATMQPAADNLAALAGLEAVAGRVPYFTGAGAMATTPTTAFGRGWLNLADAAAGRGTLAAASQASLDALSTTTTAADALKADKTITVTGAGLVTGGGALSANRTLSVAEASEAEALAGAAADKAMTPRRTMAVVEATVDAAVSTLQAGLDDLAAGQGAGTIAAESWTALAAYPTTDRADGDYARVIGADAGTHTDPVAGGTVANRGAYRWSESPAGWKRVGGLESDDAAGFAAAAAASAAAATTNLPKLLAGLGGDVSSIFSTKSGDETLDSQTFPDGDFGQEHPDAFAMSGILAQVGVNVSDAGTARLLTRDPVTQEITWFTDVTLTAGVNLLTGGGDFPFRYVAAGESLLFYQTSGGNIRTGANAAGPQRYFGLIPGAPPPAEGDTVSDGALVTWTAPFAFSYTLVSSQDPNTEPTEIRSRTRVVSQHFAGSSAPAGWSLGSAFAVNDGLESTGPGGWGNYAYQASYSAVTRRELAARVTFSDASSKWAIATRPDPTGLPYCGGACVIDGSTGKIGLYAWDTSTPSGILLVESACPTLATDVPYILRARTSDQSVSSELIDSNGEVVASVSADNFMVSGRSVAFKGGLAAIHFSGTVKVDWLEAHHLCPKRLKLVIVGDSNIAGDVTPAIGKTWPMRLAALRPQKDIMISAIGGDVGHWLSRQALDLDPFQPEMVLTVLGSNYNSLATWRNDMSAMIAATVAVGAEPVIATQIPRGTAQTLMNEMNADILSGYFGDLRIVDIAAAITDNGDRETWHTPPGTDNGDHIHMNIAGQIDAFVYVRDECPWLWLDAPDAFLA